MRRGVELVMLLALLFGSIGCKKAELKENEIIGKWDCGGVVVDVIFSHEIPAEKTSLYSNMVQMIFGSVFGGALQGIECLPNNELRIKSFDLSTAKDIDLSGVYYYRPNEQFSMETDVQGDADLGFKMVLFGGLVGMQYTPEFFSGGDSLVLKLDSDVAAALARVLLLPDNLHELYSISQVLSVRPPDEAVFKKNVADLLKEMEGMELESIFVRK